VDWLVEYKPIKEVKIQWKLGSMIWKEGQEVIVEETLPCILKM
jgi:hypothetical protein